MKKSDLTVGMTVEDQYGVEVVVLDVSGWKRDPNAWARRSFTFTMPSGQKVTASGVLRGGPGVMIARAVMTGSAPWGQLEQPRNLHPVGTFAAAEAERKAADTARRDAAAEADAALLAQVHEAWGDSAGWLFMEVGISPLVPLTERAREAMRVMLACHEARYGEGSL